MRRGFTYKIVSILLTTAMMAQLCPVSAWAAGDEGAGVPAAELPAGAGDEDEVPEPEESVPSEVDPEAVGEEVPGEAVPTDEPDGEVTDVDEMPEAVAEETPEAEDSASAPEEEEEAEEPEGDPEDEEEVEEPEGDPGDVKYSGRYRGIDWCVTNDGVLVLGCVGEVQGWTGGDYWDDSWPWSDYSSDIRSARVDGVVRVGSCHRMFSDLSKLQTADLRGLDVSNVTDMEYMFSGCSRLSSVNTSGWNTAQVTDMEDMFHGCSKLGTLDASHWDVGNVTDMQYMFSYCTSLRELKAANWNTGSVEDMQYMFSGCSSLLSLDASRWDTSSVKYMSGMFNNCWSLASLNTGNWNISHVKSLSSMFYGCSLINNLDLSKWDVGDVTSLQSMFSGCTNLASLNLSGWDTYAVTSMSYMFYGCSSLSKLNVSGWDTGAVTDMQSMFEGCVSLSSLNLSSWDTSTLSPGTGYESGASSMMGGVGINEITLGGSFYFKGRWSDEYGVPLLHVNKEGDTWNTYTKGTWKRKDGTGSALTTKQLIAYHSSSRPKTTWVWQGEKYKPTSLAGASITNVENQLYTGSAIMPKVTVKLGGKTLKQDTDYYLTYQNNTDLGTAAVIANGTGSYTGSVVDTFGIVSNSLKNATVAKIPDQKCTGKPLQPAVTVTIGGTTLKQGTDYKVSYKNNVAGGTATVTITGIGDYAGTKTATFKISDKWQRIWGQNGYDTMRAILKTDSVFTTSSVSTVVLASRDSFQDPLAATALAGTFRAPLLLCSKNSLASQTKAELKRLKPSRIIVVGYGSSVSARVASDAKSAAGAKTVTQVKGASAEARAVAAYNAGRGKWSRTCIIATQNSYKDSLSASPYAYTKKCPIFFVGARRSAKEGGRLSAATLSAIKKGGFTRIVIVGGPVAVSNYVQTTQLKGKKVERWYGSNGIDTSRVIAQRALGEGMGVSHVAVATTGGYVDALAGAALAGRQNSVLLLANKTGGYGAFDALSAQIKGGVKHGHILGGTAAISEASANHFREAQ